MLTLFELGIRKELAENIEKLIENDRLPHAILLRGGSAEKRGILSSFLAQAFVCENEIKPCGKCSHCMKVESGSHPDVITVDPSLQNEKIFKINLVREMKDDSYIIPNEASKKVYILKSADKMNIQAQNALLKLIEEPPSYARFILECETSSAMLETIMSRVTLYDLGANTYDLSDELIKKADDTAARLAAAILKPTEYEFMKITAEFEKNKELFEPTLSALQLIFRDAVVIKAESDITLSNHNDISREAASKLTLNSLIKMTTEIDNLKESINRNANKNLLITRFSAVMRSSAYER
jgi:DNA polymerase-3 subunit delta'